MLQQRKCVDFQKLCHNVLFSIIVCTMWIYTIRICFDGVQIDAYAILLADFMFHFRKIKVPNEMWHLNK